jgi:choline transport protein
VPWAIVSSVVVNGVLGFALLLALLFCLGNVDAALNTPTGFPFIEIFAQATNGNGAATAMTVLVLILLTASAPGVMATASRLLWSLARDNGVPGSRYISRVSHFLYVQPLRPTSTFIQRSGEESLIPVMTFMAGPY